MLQTIERKMQLEQLDTRSNHVWRYEIDAVANTVDIYKNGKRVRRVNCVISPVSDSWLGELRADL